MLPVLRRGSWLTPANDDPFTSFRGEVDSLFDRFFGSDGGFTRQAWSGVPLAMWEDDEHVNIEAELPGLADKDVEVTVHNGMLFLRGERRPDEGRSYLYNTRSYGRFERIVALPATVNPDNIKATLSNGVLHIQLAKSPEARPKRITVESA